MQSIHPLTHAADVFCISGDRGAATTEMALLMIILVPLTLYIFFFGEVGILTLDSQEQIIAALWDHAVYPYNMSKSPKWLLYNGKKHGEQNQISAHNRLQYADSDSSFTNEARFQGNFMDMSKDYFSTLAFVQPTHCDGDCMNYRHDYEDKKVHEIVCGMEDAGAGKFLEGKIPLSSTEVLRRRSKGGLIICQEKVRLKNYLLMNHFMPEFISTSLWEGDRYVRGKRVIDNKSDYKDIVIRHRAVILADTWANIENPDTHQNTNTVSLLKNKESNTEFYATTNAVLNTSLFSIPTLAAVSYMQDALSKNLAFPLALPTGTLSSAVDSNVLTKVSGMINKLGGAAGLPNIMALSMVANYSHNGNSIDDYKYAMTGDIGDKLFTTPLFNKYEEAWKKRGKYYLGTAHKKEG